MRFCSCFPGFAHPLADEFFPAFNRAGFLVLPSGVQCAGFYFEGHPVSPVVLISEEMGGCYGQTMFQSLEFYVSYSRIVYGLAPSRLTEVSSSATDPDKLRTPVC